MRDKSSDLIDGVGRPVEPQNFAATGGDTAAAQHRLSEQTRAPLKGMAGHESRLTVLVFVLFFASYSLFHGPGGENWNTISRLALVANLVERGRLNIDGYAESTGDKAFFRGHYYSDKAPGLSLIALPAGYAFTRFVPVSPKALQNKVNHHTRWNAFAYFCTLFTSVLLTALAGACLFRYLLMRTGEIGAALVGSIAYALATPTWGWATVFMGHAPAGALLILGLLACEDALDSTTKWRELRGALLCGALLGAAILVEFTAVGPALFIVCYALARFVSLKRLADGLVLCGVGALAGAAFGIVLLVYNYMTFGSPFILGYQHVVGFNGMDSGFFGVGVPRVAVLYEILFGSYRGVLVLSPILAFAAVGLGDCFRRSETRAIASLIASIALWYLLVNSSYHYWTGGFSTGPRHITPMYPFLGLALGLWFPYVVGRLRAVLIGVLGVSVGVSLACVAVSMTAPEQIGNPLVDYILPRFLKGQWTASLSYAVTQTDSLLHMVPFAGIWGISAWLIWREAKRLRESSVMIRYLPPQG